MGALFFGGLGLVLMGEDCAASDFGGKVQKVQPTTMWGAFLDEMLASGNEQIECFDFQPSEVSVTLVFPIISAPASSIRESVPSLVNEQLGFLEHTLPRKRKPKTHVVNVGTDSTSLRRISPRCNPLHISQRELGRRTSRNSKVLAKIAKSWRRSLEVY